MNEGHEVAANKPSPIAGEQKVLYAILIIDPGTKRLLAQPLRAVQLPEVSA